MAEYHLHVGAVSRRAGHSAVKAAAYVLRSRIRDERTGETADYSRHHNRPEFTASFAPRGAPDWAQDPAKLWNEAERAERRKDSKVARTWEFALPHEISRSERERITCEFAHMLISQHGIALTVAIHPPAEGSDERNWHAHILATTRSLGPAGFGAKTRVLDSPKTSGAVIAQYRADWARRCNHALERAGADARVDHRSYRVRGIDREPGIHLGRAEYMRAGNQTERAEHQARIVELNAAKREAADLAEQYDAVSAEIISLEAEIERRAAREAERIKRERERREQEKTHRAAEVQRRLTTESVEQARERWRRMTADQLLAERKLFILPDAAAAINHDAVLRAHRREALEPLARYDETKRVTQALFARARACQASVDQWRGGHRIRSLLHDRGWWKNDLLATFEKQAADAREQAELRRPDFRSARAKWHEAATQIREREALVQLEVDQRRKLMQSKLNELEYAIHQRRIQEEEAARLAAMTPEEREAERQRQERQWQEAQRQSLGLGVGRGQGGRGR